MESVIMSIDWKTFIGSDLEFTVHTVCSRGLSQRNSHCYHFQWKLSKAPMSFCFLSLCLLKLLNMIEQILFQPFVFTSYKFRPHINHSLFDKIIWSYFRNQPLSVCVSLCFIDACTTYKSWCKFNSK